MTNRIFGWDLPPGVTQRHIDESLGSELPCETCGQGLDHCICPECPKCGETGNPYCYDEGHLQFTTLQHIGRSKAHIHYLQQQLQDEESALLALEYKLDSETEG